jgi:hypothetical protein
MKSTGFSFSATIIFSGAMLVCGLLRAGPMLFEPPPGDPSAQRTFASPAEATNEMIRAVKAHDEQAVRAVFGSEITNLLTGDPVLDEKHFDEFASDISERCAAVPDGSNRLNLEIGSGGWVFPIPLVESNGAWFFDTTAGEDEIINRHIGRDEYYAIGVCRDYVKAQRDYAARLPDSRSVPHYAARFRSTPGKMDGLYWPTGPDGQSSPLSSFVAEASVAGYDWNGGKGPRPFHGYLFKILTRQGPAAPGGKMNYIHHGGLTGGFALLAWPVRWGESGIMTFMVNQDGTVYQRSLGDQTSRQAEDIREYNPDSHWTVVRDEGVTDLTAGQSRTPAP